MRPSESVGPSREKLFPVLLAPNAKTTEGIPCGPLCGDRRYRRWPKTPIWYLEWAKQKKNNKPGISETGCPNPYGTPALWPSDSDIIWDLQVLLCDVWSCLLIRMFLFFAWVEQLWEALQLVAMRHCHTDSDSKQIKYDSQHNMASSFWGSNMFQLQTAHFHDAIQLDQHCLKSGFFFQNPSHPLTQASSLLGLLLVSLLISYCTVPHLKTPPRCLNFKPS